MHGNVSGFSMDLWRRKTPAKNFLHFTLLNNQRICSDPSKSEISCCSRSAAQLCLTLCDPMDCSTRGFPVPPSPRACSNSCPWSQWCSPTISSSVAPFSSCPQSFSASESFPMSQDIFSYDFLSVEDIRVKQGVPRIIPLHTGHINGKNFSRAHLCCVSFSVEEM